MTTLSRPEKKLMFHTASQAARLAGDIVRKNFGKQKEILFKGRIDIVTNVDLQAESVIIDTIKSRFPDHDILTEETKQEPGLTPFRWIIDPLDGTVNYAHNYPFCSVSIALEIEGVIELGIVYNPIREEFFSAKRGDGAFLNNAPVQVSQTNTLEKSLLATGFPYDIRENPRNNLAQYNHIIMHAQALRRDGCSSLDLSYCAMGALDGYWEISIAPWDIAAGTLLLTEAGGKVTNFKGKPLSIYENQIVASNGKIHKELLKELKKSK